MKFPQCILYQLNFVVFILVELNRTLHPFLQILSCILGAEPWKLLTPVTVKDWHQKRVQFGNLKMTNTVFNRIVGLVLEKVVAFSIELYWICLSFTSFFFASQLRGLRFVEEKIVLQKNWVVLEGGFSDGLNDLEFKVAGDIGWECQASVRVSVDFEGVDFDGRFENGWGIEERAKFVIDIFHTRIILFVYKERVFGSFKNWCEKKLKN